MISTLLGVILLIVAPLVLIYAHHSRAVSTTDKNKKENFVGSGIYTYSRHPQYVAYVLLMIGLAFCMNSLVAMLAPVVAVVFFTFAIIPHQERLLSEQFPEAYDEYKKKVPMWI